jgi:nitrile hydratase subunit alpha
LPETFVSDFTDHAEDEWITDNGARMVARAWVENTPDVRNVIVCTLRSRTPHHHRRRACAARR